MLVVLPQPFLQASLWRCNFKGIDWLVVPVHELVCRWITGFKNWDLPRATGYQPTEFKGSLPKRCWCLGLGQNALSCPNPNPQNAIGVRLSAFGGSRRCTLNLIPLCQRKSSLWFHRALPPFRRRCSESMARNCFQSHLREVLCKKYLKFPALHRQSILYLLKRTRKCRKGHVLRASTLAFLERLFVALQPLVSVLNTPLQVKLWDASYTHIPSKS